MVTETIGKITNVTNMLCKYNEKWNSFKSCALISDFVLNVSNFVSRF